MSTPNPSSKPASKAPVSTTPSLNYGPSFSTHPLEYLSDLRVNRAPSPEELAQAKRNLRYVILFNLFNALWVGTLIALTWGPPALESASQAWRALVHPTPSAPALEHLIDVSKAA